MFFQCDFNVTELFAAHLVGDLISSFSNAFLFLTLTSLQRVNITTNETKVDIIAQPQKIFQLNITVTFSAIQRPAIVVHYLPKFMFFSRSQSWTAELPSSRCRRKFYNATLRAMISWPESVICSFCGSRISVRILPLLSSAYFGVQLPSSPQ